MRLKNPEALLITSDAALLNAVRTAMESLGIKLDVRSDVESAAAVAAGRRFDCYVVDCDDLPGGSPMLQYLRRSSSSQASAIFGVVNGKTSTQEALTCGASLVLSKPVTSEYARESFQSALFAIIRERRRYFRFQVELPVEIMAHDSPSIPALISNVSESGLALELRSGNIAGTVGLRFRVPGNEAGEVEGKAEVVWCDGRHAGLKFLSIPDPGRQRFHFWLGSLRSVADARQT